MGSHRGVQDLDLALSEGDFAGLARACDMTTYDDLFCQQEEAVEDLLDNDDFAKLPLRKRDLQLDLEAKHAETIARYENRKNDYPVVECVCCNLLFQRKGVTGVKLEDDLGPVWVQLKQFIGQGALKLLEEGVEVVRELPGDGHGIFRAELPNIVAGRDI